MPKMKSSDSFTIYDCTKLFNSDFMPRIGFSYMNELWGRGKRTPLYPPEENIEKAAAKLRRVNPDRGILDIEHWENSLHESDEATVRQTVERLSVMFDKFKAYNPNMELGFYSMVPHEIYTHELNARLKRIFEKNNELLQPLADKVDLLCPSFYTRWQEDHIDSWVSFARIHIEKAREMGGDKPVLPFIWPQYGYPIYGAPNGSRLFEYLPSEYWYTILETLKQYADGAIVYLPYDINLDENRKKKKKINLAENQSWYGVTRRFVRNN